LCRFCHSRCLKNREKARKKPEKNRNGAGEKLDRSREKAGAELEKNLKKAGKKLNTSCSLTLSVTQPHVITLSMNKFMVDNKQVGYAV